MNFTIGRMLLAMAWGVDRAMKLKRCGAMEFWQRLRAIAVAWACGYGSPLVVIAIALALGCCILIVGRMWGVVFAGCGLFLLPWIMTLVFRHCFGPFLHCR